MFTYQPWGKYFIFWHDTLILVVVWPSLWQEVDAIPRCHGIFHWHRVVYHRICSPGWHASIPTLNVYCSTKVMCSYQREYTLLMSIIFVFVYPRKGSKDYSVRPFFYLCRFVWTHFCLDICFTYLANGCITMRRRRPLTSRSNYQGFWHVVLYGPFFLASTFGLLYLAHGCITMRQCVILHSCSRYNVHHWHWGHINSAFDMTLCPTCKLCLLSRCHSIIVYMGLSHLVHSKYDYRNTTLSFDLEVKFIELLTCNFCLLWHLLTIIGTLVYQHEAWREVSRTFMMPIRRWPLTSRSNW